ncbi:MAG: hypothetical protein M3425_04025 [Actinomycetota bacterium]|nr:hypothetical protein [Actinomycetota bacterium]
MGTPMSIAGVVDHPVQLEDVIKGPGLPDRVRQHNINDEGVVSFRVLIHPEVDGSNAQHPPGLPTLSRNVSSVLPSSTATRFMNSVYGRHCLSR